MNLSRKLNAPKTFIYNKLIESSIHDIKTSTGVELTPEELKGYEYSKTFPSGHKATIHVVDIIENELYQFKTTTSIREFMTTYKIKELPNNRCEVICTETIESHGPMLKYNDMLTGAVLGWSKRKQLKKILDSMAATYNKE